MIIGPLGTSLPHDVGYERERILEDPRLSDVDKTRVPNQKFQILMGTMIQRYFLIGQVV